MLVVGNGSSNALSSILFPSVSKAVAKLKKVPVAVVGASSVQHYGNPERAGEVQLWDGGCALQVSLSQESMHHCMFLVRPRWVYDTQDDTACYMLRSLS